MSLLILAICCAELDADWFKANYLPAAEKLEKAYSKCSGKVSVINTNDKSFNTAEFTFAIDGPRRKFDRTIEDHKDGTIDGFRRVIVASPEVSFHLLTRRGQPTFLDYIDRSSAGIAQAGRRIEEVASESIYSAFAFMDMRVSSWMNRKGFQIKSVKREGGKVRLNFHCEDDLEYDGWVDFLPDRQWVIDGWEITLQGIEPTPDPWRIVATVNYGPDDPVPVLTGMTTIRLSEVVRLAIIAGWRGRLCCRDLP